MDYTYRCAVCDSAFPSFKALTEHKKQELNEVARIQREHPEWSLQQCFDHLLFSPESLPHAPVGGARPTATGAA